MSAGVSSGRKAGGWSAYTAHPDLAPFDSERLLAFEAGVESSFADNAVTLAARGFLYRIRDYQIERSFNPEDYLVVNAPRARAVGGELEASWRPLQALTLTAALGLADITLREFTDPFSGASHAGRRAPYAPAHDAHVSATYRKAGWFVAGEASMVGRTFYDESESPQFTQKARTLANVRLGYDADRWRATVYADNLFDEGYHALIVPGVGHAAPGAPRTLGVEVVMKR
jgi:iron complex outermembrane receptor protein